MGNTSSIFIFKQKSANYTLTDLDTCIECTANSFTITLPLAKGVNGRHFIIKNSGSGVVILMPSGGELIDGEASITLSANDSIEVVSNFTNYIILSSMSNNTITKDFALAVAMGEVEGYEIMSALGERENVGTTTTGEDIWRGSAKSIPIPASTGEQFTVVSDDAQDNSTGTGVRTIRLHIIRLSDGKEYTEDITMNGTTGVNTVITDGLFINDAYSLTTGSNGVAEGVITIYKTGSSSTVYNMIDEGGNKSLVPNRMIPSGKTLTLKRWHATEAQGRRQTVRIRSTDMKGTLIPGVFCFKDVAYLSKSTTGELELNEKIPSFSIVKVSSWAIVAGGEVSCSWWGILGDE